MPAVLARRLWPAHLLGLLACAAAVALGLWQLDAWRAHRAAEAVDLTTATPVPLAETMGPDDPFPGDRVGQPVRLTGDWVPGGTVYIRDRLSGGHTGLWAVTPLSVDGADGAAMLVVRGWTPSLEAAPAPPTGRASLVGWLEPPEGEVLTDDDPTDDVLPQVRIADAIQRVDQDLYGAFVVADVARSDSAGSAGLTPVVRHHATGADWSTALRNLLYALQWWVFAGFAAFIWWRHVSDALAAQRADADGAAADSDAVDPEPVPRELG